MLKIVVFDSGWGGELVANFLEEELNTVEIVRVIDWPNAPYCNREAEEICALVDDGLFGYIGGVDLIVLGGYAVSMALDFMCEKYPEQRFVGMDLNYDLILRSRNFPGNVVMLMDRLTSESVIRQNLRAALPYSTLIIPDCTGWEELINDNRMTPEVLRQDLGYDFTLAPVQEKRMKPESNESEMSLLEIIEKAEDKGGNRQALRTAIAKFSQAAEAAVDDEKMMAQALMKQNAEIERRNDWKPDVILLLNTHFWDIKLDLEEIFGWQVRVLDFREKLLHDVCVALKLRGTHGGRAK